MVVVEHLGIFLKGNSFGLKMQSVLLKVYGFLATFSNNNYTVLDKHLHFSI